MAGRSGAVAQVHHVAFEEIGAADDIVFVGQRAHFRLGDLQRREMLRCGAPDRGQRRAEHIGLVAGAVEIADLDQPGQQRMAGRPAELQRAHQIGEREGLARMVGDEIENGGDAPDTGGRTRHESPFRYFELCGLGGWEVAVKWDITKPEPRDIVPQTLPDALAGQSVFLRRIAMLAVRPARVAAVVVLDAGFRVSGVNSWPSLA